MTSCVFVVSLLFACLLPVCLGDCGNAVLNIDVTRMGVQIHGSTCADAPSCQQTWDAKLSSVVNSNSSMSLCRGRNEIGHQVWCEKPGGTVTVSFYVQNTGVSVWGPLNNVGVRVELTNPVNIFGQVSSPVMLPSAGVQPGESIMVNITVKAPTQAEGVYVPQFRLTGPCGAFGDFIYVNLQSTCSDQYFCNGVEHWINGTCAPSGGPACDDHEPCTTDICDEVYGRCAHIANTTDPSCYVCGDECLANQVANCTGKACGPDGCLGSCGTCSGGFACVANELGGTTCEAVSSPGSCSNPIPLEGGSTLGFRRFFIDTRVNSYNNIVPTCNQQSDAVDLVYTFEVTQAQADAGLFLDARLSDARFPIDDPTAVDELHDPEVRDTVLELRYGRCGEPGPGETPFHLNVDAWCSDDATPPGGYGSRINVQLKAGTYYLALDAYSSENVGPMQLEYKFLTYKPVCDGTYCGPDGRGGDCGPCPSNHTCGADRRCYTDTCQRNCVGKQCGPDGCGGYCGNCNSTSLCQFSSGTCQTYKYCNRTQVACDPPCGPNLYCASNCTCLAVTDPLPDLVVDVDILTAEMSLQTINFTSSHCGVVEGCVSKPGVHRMLRFSIGLLNQGKANVILDPPASRPDMFTWSGCHAHFHVQGYARYTLLSGNQVLTRGGKTGYCLEDVGRLSTFQGPAVACKPVSTCSEPGLQVGWTDLYGQDLDCQWVDITGIKPGLYTLRIETNEQRVLVESDYDNNVVEIPVFISSHDGPLVNMGPGPLPTTN